MDDTGKTVSVEAIMESAQHAFWAEVVKHLPLASSGDFDPMSSLVFEEAMEHAIITWWDWNASIHYNLKKTNGEILEVTEGDFRMMTEDEQDEYLKEDG